MQFGGAKLSKEKKGIKQEESYLPRIFRLSSFNWHTFHHIYIVVHCPIYQQKL